VGAEGAKELAHILVRYTTLHQLNLSGNHVEQKHYTLLHDTTLHLLKLEVNKVGDEGGNTFAHSQDAIKSVSDLLRIFFVWDVLRKKMLNNLTVYHQI